MTPAPETGKSRQRPETLDGDGKGVCSQDDTDVVYPSGLKLALLLTSIFIGMFLVSLVC